MTEIPCPVIESARQYCGHTALVDRDTTFSYDTFDRRTAALAATFAQHGLRTGDRLAILGDNSALLVLTIAACIRSSIVFCPLSRRWPESMIDDALDILRPAAILTENARTDVMSITLDQVNAASRASADHAISDMPVQRRADLPAGIIFTSGSDAKPKAVLHTLGNYYYSALGSNRNIRLGPTDRWLLSLPLYHVGGIGILFRAWCSGATVAVPNAGDNLYDSAIQLRATHLSCVTTQLRRLLDDDKKAKTLSRQVKAVLIGGSSVSDNLILRACDYGLPVYKSYGLTEMTSQVTTTSHDDLPSRVITSGRLLPHRQIRISQSGEILVRGETLFAGYVRHESVERPIDSDGWFATGDLGRIDADGCLIVTGRRDNMFISGGENIQPELVEQALCSLDGIEDALVLPAPDEEFDFRPVAFVRCSENTELDSDHLRLALAPLIPRYAIPVRFLPWPETDTGPGLKPSRKLLAEFLEGE